MTDRKHPGHDEFWASWNRAPITTKEIEVDQPVVTTRLMYLEDVEKGTVIRFSRCKKPTEEDIEKAQANPIQSLFGGVHHEEEDYDVTVLDRREQGGIVSLILVDADGEQVPHIDAGIKTVRVVVAQ